MTPLTPEEARRVAPYVTNTDQPVFALRNLPPEVCAYLFARYSRSREGVRQMLLAMLDDSDAFFSQGAEVVEQNDAQLEQALTKARAFAEKWIAGYGHKSPAEVAPIHLCFEGVSILFTKVIEDFRLTSPQEKSTRYVIFSRETLYRPTFRRPDGSIDQSLTNDVSHYLDGMMDAYHRAVEAVKARCKEVFAREEGQSERGYETLMTTKACDLCRYLLPVATETNAGVFANAREWEYVISRLLSHELPEAREMGQRVLDEATKVAPTLIKYARFTPYYAETPARMRELAQEQGPEVGDRGPVRASGETYDSGRAENTTDPRSPIPVGCVLHSYEEDAEAHLAAAMLYPYARQSYDALYHQLSGPEAAGERERIIDAYLSGCGPWYTPLRAVENAVYRIEFTCDYGAYRDLQRHRIGTSLDPVLTPHLGAAIPEEIVEWGFAPVFEEAFERSAALWSRIMERTDDALQAQYVLPMMANYRFFRVWNLRQVMNVIKLRSARQGHTSYRQAAQALYREVERVHPLLARYIQVDLGDYPLAREGTKATR
ncbi:MAG: FAD-dependent thymidylate synthase [Armatimonadetes bacterium]|nr:FAD-dependent thymidylate synthase [Armatimonadota bacterium]